MPGTVCIIASGSFVLPDILSILYSLLLHVLISYVFVFVSVGATVSLENAAYTTLENSSPVPVCAVISNVPADGLECDVVATLILIDGDKAGMFLLVVLSKTVII